MHKDIIAMFLSVTNKTVYNYEKENRPIIAFLNKYFNENDINEFLSTGKMSKLETNLDVKEIKDKIDLLGANNKELLDIARRLL